MLPVVSGLAALNPHRSWAPAFAGELLRLPPRLYRDAAAIATCSPAHEPKLGVPLANT